jgi:hypothetical protein
MKCRFGRKQTKKSRVALVRNPRLSFFLGSFNDVPAIGTEGLNALIPMKSAKQRLTRDAMYTYAGQWRTGKDSVPVRKPAPARNPSRIPVTVSRVEMRCCWFCSWSVQCRSIRRSSV